MIYASGYNLPVVTDINLINPIGTLADGRPIYSTAVSAATRLDPRFNHIIDVQSIGESTFKALTLQRRQALRRNGLTLQRPVHARQGASTTRRC